MRAVIRLGAVIGVVAVICAISTAQHPGRNSFLVESAHTTDQLVDMVKTNPVIRDSYERHFRMTEDQLYSYLRTLHPMQLQHDTVFTIYSVPPGGELKAHTQRLKKGELVFADMNGKPILRARCGNPLVDTPAGTVPQEDLVVANPPLREMGVPEAEIVPNVPLAMAPAPPVVPEEVVYTPPTPVVTTHAQSFLPIIPLLALPVVGGGNNGGGPPGNPTPEPATMAALAVGASALIAKKRKKS